MYNRKRFQFGFLMLAAFLMLSVSEAFAAGAYKPGIIGGVDFTALEQVLGDSTLELKSIVVNGYASPEGAYATNAKLARVRANQLKNYLVSHYRIPKNMITINSVGEDWEGVESFISSSEDEVLAGRDSLLQAIKANGNPDAKEKVLRRNFPDAYKYLSKYSFPQLRRATYTLDYQKKEDIVWLDEPYNHEDGINQELASVQDETIRESGLVQNEIVQNLTTVQNEINQESISELVYQTPASVEEVVNPVSISEVNETLASVEDNSQQVSSVDVLKAAEDTVASLKENLTIIDGHSVNSQKVRRDNLEIVETLVADTIHGDALVTFLINEAEMRSDISSNEKDLNKIVAMLDQVFNDTTIRLQNIIVSGYASPDGPYARNEKLAAARTQILKQFIVDRYHLGDELLETRSVAEDWEGLEKYVENASEEELPHKTDILTIIRNNDILPDAKERMIRRLKVDFEHLKVNCLPKLRRSEYYIQYFKQRRYISTTVIEDPKEPDTVTVVNVPVEKKPFYFAAKTNLLYDAALLPNIGVEFYLGKLWTLTADWHYTWLYSDTRHRYWQGYGGYLGVRKYFGKKAEEHPFTGHHLGLYGQTQIYDVEFGGRGYQMPDWGYGGGIEYGYSLPIARRFNLDFSLGVGYVGGTTKEYLPLDGHYVWQVTKKLNWFGPTKAEISLKWLIGRGNYHKKYDKKMNN